MSISVSLALPPPLLGLPTVCSAEKALLVEGEEEKDGDGKERGSRKKKEEEREGSALRRRISVLASFMSTWHSYSHFGRGSFN